MTSDIIMVHTYTSNEQTHSQPTWFVPFPSEVAHKDDGDQQCYLEKAGHESYLRVGQLIATP